MAATISLLSDAELHALVDGRLEGDGRSDVLRRLAASAPDRALVAAWKEQGDLIRSAFCDVERESLPRVLDLAAPRLRCIDGTERRQPVPLQKPRDLRRRGIAMMTLLVVSIGLVGVWMMIAQPGRGDGVVPVAPQTTLDATLADRAATALEGRTAGTGTASASDGGLPTFRIPDLTDAGLTLTNVSTQPGEPATLVLQYHDAGETCVALSVARLPADAAPSGPAAIGRSFAWHGRSAAYAIAGTLPADKLQKIAAALHDDAAN